MPEIDYEDDLNEVLRTCVMAAGGYKVVGARLWGDKAPDAAGRHLANCLNSARQERLSPAQVLAVARIGRQHGCHAYMQHLADTLHYEAPVPRTALDAAAELQRQLVEATREVNERLARMAELQEAMLSAAAGARPLRAVGGA